LNFENAISSEFPKTYEDRKLSMVPFP
jgi:hypothetical protein